MQIHDQITTDLHLPKHFVAMALNRAFVKCFPIRIPKKGGGFRKAVHPPTELKVIQYWLLKNVFCHFKTHKAATAYVKGASIRNNAMTHSNGIFFIKLDFADFFRSISYNEFEPHLKLLLSQLGYKYGKKERKLFEKTCFDLDGRLPIGYPTSPVISNVVMCEFDENITQFLTSNQEKLGNVKYTRYADDMFFSCSDNSLALIHEYIRGLVGGKESIFHFLKLNSEKTKFFSKGRGNTRITGLRVCYDGHVTLHKRYKDQIRLALSMRHNGVQTRETDTVIRGHLSHIRSADPIFYTKLVTKYLKTIKKLGNY